MTEDKHNPHAPGVATNTAAIDRLRSVLCDTSGRCCIAGSDADRLEVDAALAALVECASAMREADYESGWRVAASWAGRQDLHDDIGSPAYVADRDAALVRPAQLSFEDAVKTADRVAQEVNAAEKQATSGQAPIAWLHSNAGRADIVHAKVRDLWLMVDAKRVEHYTIPLYLRAQALPQSPSYDALLIIVQSVAGALHRAGLDDCDDPGEAIDVMRERYEKRIAELGSKAAVAAPASAPQSAAVQGEGP